MWFRKRESREPWEIDDEMVISGQQPIKKEAVAAAEKAIDRALAAKKVRLVPLPRRGLTDEGAVPVSAPQSSKGGCTPSGR
jgi:hypothetical protein